MGEKKKSNTLLSFTISAGFRWWICCSTLFFCFYIVKVGMHKAMDANTWDFFSFCLMCFKEKDNIGHAEFGLKKQKLWNVITAASQCDSIVLLCPCPTCPEIHNNQLTMQISQHAVWELFWLVCNLQRLPLLLSNESFSYVTSSRHCCERGWDCSGHNSGSKVLVWACVCYLSGLQAVCY